MKFEFKAINNSGHIINDTLVVDDMSQVYTELSQRGLVPVSVKEDKSSGAGNDGFSIQQLVNSFNSKSTTNGPDKASKKELPFFITQLAILLETGTQVAPSLLAIEKQLKCPNWKFVVSQLRQHVEEGGSLASAVELYPKIFDPIYVSMISAGETSGRLSEILNRLADLSQRADRINSKIKSAMIYPALLTFIAINVLSVLIFFVLPRFENIFVEMKVDLPGSTKVLLAISHLVRNNLVLSILAVIMAIVGFIYWIRSSHGKRLISKYSIKVPIFGSLITSLINARIFRLLGLLLESDVPFLDSLALTKNSTDHFLYAELIQDIHDNVLVGQPMFEVMQRSNLVDASISQMVQTGEENGQIGKVMTLLADYMDDKNDTKISTLTSIMEPVILIFMGLIIGVIAISLVLPMFDLSKIAGS